MELCERGIFVELTVEVEEEKLRFLLEMCTSASADDPHPPPTGMTWTESLTHIRTV